MKPVGIRQRSGTKEELRKWRQTADSCSASFIHYRHLPQRFTENANAFRINRLILYNKGINQQICSSQEEIIMIRRSSEKTTITKPAPFDGVGEITVRNLLNGPEEMEQKGRVFCHTTVHPGSEIGLHTHKGDAETYYILSGHGTYNDNGKITDVQPGDVYYCGEGQCHSIKAIDEPIEMIALILYTTK